MSFEELVVYEFRGIGGLLLYTCRSVRSSVVKSSW